MILQINEINENELHKLVNDDAHQYYIGKSKEGMRSVIIRVNCLNEKMLYKVLRILLS